MWKQLEEENRKEKDHDFSQEVEEKILAQDMDVKQPEHNQEVDIMPIE